LVVAIGPAALLALGGCSTTHEFRVAAVGDSSQAASDSTAAGDSSSGPLIVAAGNALLGPASKLPKVGGGGPGTELVDGTVSALLLTTDQTLVQLSNGSSLLLNGLGGTLGDAVSVDLASGRVVGGPGSLVGTNVLATGPSGGQLLTATVGGNSLVGRSGVTRSPTAPVRSGTSTVTGVVSPVLGPVCC
jgi:hypothetical protein